MTVIMNLFQRLYSVNQAHNIYWKKTKNPANKQLPHLEDCVFLNDPNDPNGLIRLLMPGGNAVFKMKNVFFGGARQSGREGVIMAPQVGSSIRTQYFLTLDI